MHGVARDFLYLIYLCRILDYICKILNIQYIIPRMEIKNIFIKFSQMISVSVYRIKVCGNCSQYFTTNDTYLIQKVIIQTRNWPAFGYAIQLT